MRQISKLHWSANLHLRISKAARRLAFGPLPDTIRAKQLQQKE
jgi:hypothetical protein